MKSFTSQIASEGKGSQTATAELRIKDNDSALNSAMRLVGDLLLMLSELDKTILAEVSNSKTIKEKSTRRAAKQTH